MRDHGAGDDKSHASAICRMLISVASRVMTSMASRWRPPRRPGRSAHLRQPPRGRAGDGDKDDSQTLALMKPMSGMAPASQAADTYTATRLTPRTTRMFR